MIGCSWRVDSRMTMRTTEEAQDLAPGVEQFLREVTGQAEEDDSDDDSTN